MSETTGKYSRRTMAFFGLVILGIVIGILLYFEQIAILYVLATLGLTWLLLTVSFADLEKVGRENVEGNLE
jgi:hypothetical protein